MSDGYTHHFGFMEGGIDWSIEAAPNGELRVVVGVDGKKRLDKLLSAEEVEKVGSMLDALRSGGVRF